MASSVPGNIGLSVLFRGQYGKAVRSGRQRREVRSRGTNYYGEGFILTSGEAKQLLADESRNRDVLFPDLTGDDLNSRPDQSPSRWVIDFRGNASLDEASAYASCFQIVAERVRRYRETVRESRTRQNWWLHARSRPELWTVISDMKNVVVISCIAKHAAFVRMPSRTVFDHNMAILADESWEFFTVVCSNLHLVWVIEFSSTVENTGWISAFGLF